MVVRGPYLIHLRAAKEAGWINVRNFMLHYLHLTPLSVCIFMQFRMYKYAFFGTDTTPAKIEATFEKIAFAFFKK